MKYEELPENMQKQINDLKHCAQTILSDVLDALESAENLEEFRPRSIAIWRMEEIISEAQKISEVLGMGKMGVVHG